MAFEMKLFFAIFAALICAILALRIYLAGLHLSLFKEVCYWTIGVVAGILVGIEFVVNRRRGIISFTVAAVLAAGAFIRLEGIFLGELDGFITFQLGPTDLAFCYGVALSVFCIVYACIHCLTTKTPETDIALNKTKPWQRMPY